MSNPDAIRPAVGDGLNQEPLSEFERIDIAPPVVPPYVPPPLIVPVPNAEAASIRFDHSAGKDEIRFLGSPGVEVLRLAANGDIFVKGRLVENDKEVVDGFKEWLAQAQSASAQPVPGG